MAGPFPPPERHKRAWCIGGARCRRVGGRKYIRMQNEASPGKAERQRLIASLVTRKRIGTQFELLARWPRRAAT